MTSSTSKPKQIDEPVNAVNNIIEKLGIGKFSYLLIIKLSTVYFVYGAEVTLLGIIAPFLKCEWTLSSFQTSIVTSSVIFGTSLGFLFWGWFADKVGRKPTLMISQFIAFFFSLMGVFSPNYLWFSALRFFVGFGCASFVIPGCLLAEYLPIKIRGVGLILSMMCFNFGSVFTACMAYFILQFDHWQWFLVSCTLPILVSFAVSLTLPESVRFLANKSRLEEIRIALQNIAGQHGKTLDEKELARIQPLWHHVNDESFKSLFTPERRWKVLAVAFLFSANLVSYYGFIVWNTDLQQRKLSEQTVVPHCVKLTRPEYIENILVSCSGFIGTLSSASLIEFVGRKKIIICSLAVVLLLHLSLNFQMSIIVFSVVMFVGRAVSSIGLPASNVYMNELFITSVRAKALGFANFFGTVLNVFMPFLIQDVAHAHMFLVTVIMAVICLVGIIACCTQKETGRLPIDIQTEWEKN